MRDLLERMEKKSPQKKEGSQAIPKRGTVYSETDVAVTVKLSTKEMGRLIKQKKLTVRAVDANKQPHTYTVTIELGGRGVGTVGGA